MSTKTATKIKQLKDFTGEAILFQLSEPVAYDYDWDAEQYKSMTQFVVVSATDAMHSGPETYIFPANEQGEVIHWSELYGSFKGALDHDTALRNAGFEVIK